jgi:hypothetical protein
MAITIPVRLQGQATASGNSVNFELSPETTPVPGLPGAEIADNIIIDFTSAGSVVPGLPDVDDINGFGPLAALSSPPPATPDVQLPTPEFSFITDLGLEYTGEPIIVTPGGIVEAEYEIFGGDFVISFGDRTLDLNGDGTTGTGELKLVVPEGTEFLVEYIGSTELPPETPPEGAIELQFESFVDNDGDGLLNQAYWMFDADPNNRETFDGNPANQIPDEFFVDNIEIPAGTYLATAFQLIAESLQDPAIGNISDWAWQSQGIFYETVDIDAKITIEPDDTNEVGDDHTFTVTVWVDDGTGSDVDGEMGTFDRVGAGEEVAVTLSDQFGAMNVPSTPLAGVTDADGEFEVTFTSDTAGQVIGNATTTVNVRGFDLTRTTDGIAPNSGPATKTFVDAKITITPDDTNEVGDPHTFTVTVWADDGTGTDLDGEMGTFDRVGAGEDVAVTLSDQFGAMNVPSTPLSGVTDADGEFEVTFTSDSAGQVIGSATSNVDVGGLVLPRTTDGTGNNSGPATKTFVDAKILIGPDDVNPVGEPHTFTTSVWVDDGTGSDTDGEMGTFDRFDGAPVTVTLTGENGAVPDLIAPEDLPPTNPTQVMGATDASGEFDVTFTSATAGQVIGNAETTVEVTGPDGTVVTLMRETDGLRFNSDDAVKEFIDEFQGCTPGFWKSNAANFARKPDKFGADTDGDGINDAPAAWALTGVDPSDPLLSVGFMGFTVQDGDDTFFVDALDANGGGENALMRHAAAAYLNAAHPFITYRLSTDEIVDSVNAALGSGDRHIIEDLKDDLDEFNNFGCSIDQFGRPMDHSIDM